MQNQDETQESIIQGKEEKIDYLIGLDGQTRVPGFYSKDIYLEIFREIAEVADYYKQKMLDSVFDKNHEKYQTAEEIFNTKVRKFIQEKKEEYESESAHDAFQEFELLAAIYYLHSNKPGETKKIIIEYVEKLSATKADSQINYQQCVENRKILKQLLGFVSERKLFDVQQKEKIKNAIQALKATEKSFINNQVNVLTRYDQVSSSKIAQAEEILESIPRDQSSSKGELEFAIRQGVILNWFKENFLNPNKRDVLLDRYRRITSQNKNSVMAHMQVRAREKDIKSFQKRIEGIMKDNTLTVDKRVEGVQKTIEAALERVDAKKFKSGSVGMGNFQAILKELQQDIYTHAPQPVANLTEKLPASRDELGCEAVRKQIISSSLTIAQRYHEAAFDKKDPIGTSFRKTARKNDIRFLQAFIEKVNSGGNLDSYQRLALLKGAIAYISAMVDKDRAPINIGVGHFKKMLTKFGKDLDIIGAIGNGELFLKPNLEKAFENCKTSFEDYVEQNKETFGIKDNWTKKILKDVKSRKPESGENSLSPTLAGRLSKVEFPQAEFKEDAAPAGAPPAFTLQWDSSSVTNVLNTAPGEPLPVAGHKKKKIVKRGSSNSQGD